MNEKQSNTRRKRTIRGRAHQGARPDRTRGTSRRHAPVTPVSKAKTAYGLLGEIGKVIEAEPLRYNQKLYIERIDDTHNLSVKFPSCGTVACIAGWAVVLAMPHRSVSYPDVPFVAAELLGLSDQQAVALFRGAAAGINPQTPQHAKRGVRHIEQFREQHRAQLLKPRIETGGAS